MEKLRKWEYEGLDNKGLTHSDIVEAYDYKEVIGICVKKGLYPRMIRELSKQAAINYGQLPRLKRLKEKLETPMAQQSQYSSMRAPIAQIQEKPKRKLRLNVDWVYLGFILLILSLIFGPLALKQLQT